MPALRPLLAATATALLAASTALAQGRPAAPQPRPVFDVVEATIQIGRAHV